LGLHEAEGGGERCGCAGVDEGLSEGVSTVHLFQAVCWVKESADVGDRYLELYDICSFCFDNPDTLNEFVDFYPVLPVQHVQIVLYASCLVYTDHEGGLISVPEYAGWALKLNVSWERKLKEVDEACKRIRGLTSLLISLHPEPVYQHFKNEERIIESLKMITAAPTIYVEVLGVQGRNREPVLLRSESKALVADTCRSGV